ncbi:MAG TPA: cytochrome c oxidase subunit II [Acidimicrobiales bacterium]|nr:cytochrome c oxidase subunit II [Acidimicrobiales bacterium]
MTISNPEGDGEAVATAPADAPATPAGKEPHPLRHMVPIWLVLSAVLDPLFYIYVGPHIPPGTMTSAAKDNQFDFNVLFLAAVPVLIAVWVYLGYTMVMWRASRQKTAESVGGVQARSHLGVQVGWIITTTVLVLGLFTFGTVELITHAGSGGGEGPNPIWTPTSATVLPVQVIAQQWKFTYRYPTFGGFETSQLVVPDNTTIAFHVTSLDVIHDFWAYQLSIKADANPQQDNVAYTTTRQTGSVTVRCDELCGLWHGAMFDYGKVVSKDAFMAWAKSTEAATAANTKLLPPFAYTYVPDANGADGGFYPDNVDPYSNSEVYGATPGKPSTSK